VVRALSNVSWFRLHFSKDLAAVAVSWVLVVGSLYTATVIVGPNVWGGFAYFLIYALLCATLCGVGIPLYWTVVVRRRPLADLGITTQGLGWSIALQIIFSALLALVTLAQTQLPAFEAVLPLIALAWTIGFFEAIFWRGWLLLRLEEAFGVIPAIVLGSFLYAIYHIGYAMPLNEMVFLFFVGILYAVTFRLTKNIFLLWPLFQPMGQLVTLIKDGLSLPLLGALGFFEAWIVMVALVWLAARYHNKARVRDAKVA